MAFDFSKLRGRIVEKFGTCAAFADAVGIPKSALSARLSNKIAIDSDEMMVWSQPHLLDIPLEEVHVYFLTPTVR